MKRFICYIGCAFGFFNLMTGEIPTALAEIDAAPQAAVQRVGDEAHAVVQEAVQTVVSEEARATREGKVAATTEGDVAAGDAAITGEDVVAGDAAIAGEEAAAEEAEGALQSLVQKNGGQASLKPIPQVQKIETHSLSSAKEEGASSQPESASPQESVGEQKATPEQESTAEHIHNELAKLLFLPFVADKVYAGDKIQGDLSGLILTFYPTASDETVQKFTKGIRFFVRWKRKYDYVVARLKHQIKAMKMLPKDAPIVAREGEYAPLETDLTKQTGSGEYQVSYKPYKYLEYDAGRYGEPVRRMDKNYVTTDETTYAELLLALLQFDMRAFVQAWKNIPASTDGAGERFQDFADKGEIRLLADSSLLGDQKKIRAAFDILVPEGFYINGDVLNPKNKLGFVLSETELKTNTGAVYRPSKNVSAYQIYQPLADGIQDKNSVMHRVLSGRVRVPVEFERADVTKSMRISGAFRFVLCSAKGACQPVVSYHELTLRQGVPAESSIFVNYITQGFAKYPLAQSKHVKVREVTYDAEKAQLAVQFEGTADISNMAAMVEDAQGTNFVNPRYEMKHSGGKWLGTAYFDLKTAASSAGTLNGGSVASGEGVSEGGAGDASTAQGEGVAGSASEGGAAQSAEEAMAAAESLPEVAVSASFDNREFLRLVTTPRLLSAEMPLAEQNFSAWGFFMFGLMMMLMPVMFALLFNLAVLIWQKEERGRILARFALTLAVLLGGLAVFGAEYIAKPTFYLSGPIVVAVMGLAVALMMDHLGYVDLTLFRPLRKLCKYGVFSAVFMVVVFIFAPMPYKTEVLDILGRQSDTLSLGYRLSAWGLIWLGMMILPFLTLWIAPKTTYFLLFCERINLFYTGLLLAWVVWICGAVYSLWAALLIAVFGAVMAALWYWFPIAVGEAIKHARSASRQAELFFRVQKHWLLALVLVMAVFGFGVSVWAPRERAPQTVTQEFASVKMAQERDPLQPLLITVGAAYSPRALMNLRVVGVLKKAGLTVIEIDALKNPEEAYYWFQRYQRFYPPLSVLFTARHPYGLVLPQNLKEVDFNKALSGW